MILVYITFFVGTVYYIFSKEDKAQSFVAFLCGFILGIVASIILALISFDSMQGTASVWTETTRIFLNYFLIPSLVALPLFLLFSFSLSEETFLLAPSMLLGLLTIMFIVISFTNRLEPESFRMEILLILFFSAVFLYELLIKLGLALFLSMPFIAFVLATILFLLISYAMALLLASYHFTNAKILTFIISIAILAISIIPQKLIAALR